MREYRRAAHTVYALHYHFVFIRHLWARGYFVCTSGNVTDEVIARYIEQQDVAKAGDETFRVSE